MYTPIFAGAGSGDLIGFFAINLHWIDIGGSAPRSTDIFMEGLQLRSIKLWSKGRRLDEIYRIIESNSRFPTELLGDIEAQLAGCLLGRDLTAALADRYGSGVFARAVARILDQSEAAARAEIRAMPDGTYRHEAFLDNDGVSDRRVPINVAVIVDGDEMIVDFSEMADQVPGCLNSGPHGGGRTTARVAFKYLLAGVEPANEGTFRPLRIVLPPGKIVSAHPTAPMGNYSQPFPTIIDCIIKALEHAVPERVIAGHYATFAGVRYYGRKSDGRWFDVRDGGFGGWGAGAGHDGGGPFRTMAHGDTRIIPVELQESLYPFRLEEVSLRPDSGGPGRHRGGLGMQRIYTILEPCAVDVKFDRIQCPPWGIAGGGDGRPGMVTVRRKRTGTVECFHKVKGCALEPGDIVHMEAGGGGGYGPAGERARELLCRDVRRGYISRESAARDYGFESGDEPPLQDFQEVAKAS
jgi:N-methylhydantoinase B